MITIPTTAALADYVQGAILAGTTFRLRLAFNTRDSSWYLSILGAGGDVLVAGQRVRVGFPLNRQFVGSDLPQGMLVVPDVGLDGREPGREELQDDDLPLVFLTTAEAEAAAAAE